MKRFRRMLRSTMVRYMVTYSAILCLLFTGVAVYMIRQTADTIRANLVESNINRLAKIKVENERYINTALNTANQISLSPQITPFRFLENPEAGVHVLSQLIPYTFTNDFISRLYLLFKQDTFLFSTSTSAPLDLFLNKLMRYESTTPEELLGLLRSEKAYEILPAQTLNSVLLDSNETRVITLFTSLGTLPAPNKTGTLMFIIKESVYRQLFHDEIADPVNTYIFYNGELLVSGSNMSIPPPWGSAEIMEALSNSRASLTFEGREYLLVYLKDGKYGMDYAALLPPDALRNNMQRAQATVFLSLLALLIPCVGLIWYFSKKHVSPIRELRDFFGTTEPFQNDFEAIHSGITALAEDNETLADRLDKGLSAMRSGYILHLVKGRYRTRQEAIEAAEALEIDIDKKFYTAALVEVAQELDIEQVIAMTRGVTGYGAELASGEQFLFIAFADSQLLLTAWLETLRENAEWHVSSGGIYSDLSHIGGAYLEASAAYDSQVAEDSLSAARFEGLKATPQSGVMLDIINYMQAHFLDPNLSMSSIADIYSLSTVRLSLDFKEAVGISPSEYLLRLRMERAKALLTETDIPVKDICLAVGYVDASGFIRRFRKYASVTPVQFRQRGKAV